MGGVVKAAYSNWNAAMWAIQRFRAVVRRSDRVVVESLRSLSDLDRERVPNLHYSGCISGDLDHRTARATRVQEGMRSLLLALVVASSFAACGGDDGGTTTQADAASSVPATITITGVAAEVSASGSVPLAGVTVAAYRNSADTTAIAMATTDATGTYTLTITTNGQALDGFIKATIATYMDTYLYPPFALADNFNGASLKMIKQATFDLLGTLCQGNQDAAKGTIAVIVASAPDTSAAAVAGATVASSPAATKYCYNSMTNHLPATAATSTADDGIGYMFNVTGMATVSASKTGLTLNSHPVMVRAGALTTTLIVP